jgi:hypothetical protein
VGKTRIPIDHMETRIEQEDYVYQPQTRPGPEPLDKEADEVMLVEDRGSGPTQEQSEGEDDIRHMNEGILRNKAYLTHMDEFIVPNLCNVFNLEHPEEILRSVSELVYFFMKQREQYQEPGPMDKEGRPDAGQSEEE